jgi:hypothetical protein
MMTTRAPADQVAENNAVLVSPNRGLIQRLSAAFGSFSSFIAAVLVAKAVWTCRDRIAEPDLWWHLRNAAWTFAHHKPPALDTYTFTLAGFSWLDHSWLSELVLYGAYHTWGLRGIFVIFAVVVSALSLGMFALSKEETSDPLAAGVVTIFCGLLAMTAYTPRPQLFGWLCFLGIYAILRRFRSLGHAPLWLIPLLFCLWINSHPGWPFGFVVFAIVGASGFLANDVGPVAVSHWQSAQWRNLTLTFVVSGLALLLNPYGYKLLYYPFDLAFHEKLTVGLVEEWGSVNFGDVRGVYVFIMLATIFLMAVFSSRKWRLDDVALIIFVLYAGLSHIRLLLPAAIVLAPILAPRLGKISSHVVGHERRVLNSVFVAIIVVIILVAFPSEGKLNNDIDAYFPARAVSYLKNHPIPGKIFNWYEWGGYLEWSLPQVPVFIDSRTDFFEGHAVLGDYLRIAGTADSDVILRQYEISYVLIPSETPLAYVLSTNARWQEAYNDHQCVIYQRTGE